MKLKSIWDRRLVLSGAYKLRDTEEFEHIFRLDALALSVIATATWLAGWLGGWLAGWLSVTAGRLLYQND